MAIEEGKKAPAFTLEDASGAKVSLADFEGQHVIVYFYPKDDTPGCTKEACGFRDLYKAIEKHDAVVLGISPDGAESHARFTKKYKLPFVLLSDPDKKVMTKYGAWGEKVLYGRKSVGVIRSTVIIDPAGKVAKHWKKVKSAGHAESVESALRELQRDVHKGAA